MNESERTLTEKLTTWTQQQPEYPLLFLADRRTRRRASQLMARTLFMLPTTGPVEMNRKERRAMVADVQRTIGKAKTRMSRRAQRRLRQAIRQRNRFGRLSVRRMEELAKRELKREEERKALELEQAEEFTAEALAKAAEDEALYRGDMESTDSALD